MCLIPANPVLVVARTLRICLHAWLSQVRAFGLSGVLVLRILAMHKLSAEATFIVVLLRPRQQARLKPGIHEYAPAFLLTVAR